MEGQPEQANSLGEEIVDQAGVRGGVLPKQVLRVTDGLAGDIPGELLLGVKSYEARQLHKLSISVRGDCTTSGELTSEPKLCLLAIHIGAGGRDRISDTTSVVRDVLHFDTHHSVRRIGVVNLGPARRVIKTPTVGDNTAKVLP